MWQGWALQRRVRKAGSMLNRERRRERNERWKERGITEGLASELLPAHVVSAASRSLDCERMHGCLVELRAEPADGITLECVRSGQLTLEAAKGSRSYHSAACNPHEQQPSIFHPSLRCLRALFISADCCSPMYR